jgi:Rrf2 family protein
VYISAKADYALRALICLAANDGESMTASELAQAQSLPVGFLERILLDLRRGGLLRSQRGADGGWRLARAASTITAADVMRVTDGPLADVRGLRPEDTEYAGAAEHLQRLWIAVRAGLRSVLENVTVADLATGTFPKAVERLVEPADAWRRRSS